MAQISTNEFRAGLKVEVEGQPYSIVINQFVKPGKGQPFSRVKLKHLFTGRVIERTFKSGESLELADVTELKLRLLYLDQNDAVFMDDENFEQMQIPLEKVKEIRHWMVDDQIYSILIYKGEPVMIEPPTFMEMTIAETSVGLRGDTSGRVLKPAVTQTGAQIQVPIFIDQGEIVRIDTRTGEYVARVNK